MKKLLSLLTFLLLTTSVMYAAFLRNVPCTLTQPNGTELRCFATGDEYYNYLHDERGYTIMLNPETGYYVYAIKDGDRLVPSSFIPNIHNPEEVGLKPYINISAEQWIAKRKAYHDMVPENMRKLVGDTITNRGQLNNIVIFIRFSGDSELATPYATVNGMFNDTAANANSMVNYFRKASYNQLNVTTYLYPAPNGTSIVSYQDDYPRSYYEPYSAANPSGYQTEYERVMREHTLLKNAVDEVGPSVPPTLNIDKDNDGYVDNVCFVVKGNVGGWSDLLWPHKYNLFLQTAYINNKQVNVYNFQLETAPSYFTNGTLCHEMFHTLGAPDLYHYEPGFEGMSATGPWDLMENTSNPPQHQGAYMKYKYGNWIDSIPTLTQSGTYTLHALGSASNGNVCYKIPSNSVYQYFVLEYRKKTNMFETTIPGSGLLIYRIDTRFEGNASYDGITELDEVYLFRPGGTPTSYNGNIYSAHFSSSVGRSEFNSQTDPYPFLSNGAASLVDISNISDNNSDSITFTYTLITCPAPANITSFNVASTSASLTWTGLVASQGYEVEYGLEGFTLGNGTRIYVNSNICYLSELLSSTTYDFYVRPICRATDTGFWSDCNTFTTRCEAQLLPFTEGFESTTMPSCWMQEYVSGTHDWQYTGTFSSGLLPHSGNNVAAFLHQSDGTVTKLVSPLLNLTTVTNPHLTFWHTQKIWSGDQDELRVYYKSSPTDTWQLLAEYTSDISTWTMDSIVLPNPSANYQIAFEATDGYGYGVLIDDITVKGTPIMKTVTATVNNVQYGSVTGGGSYAMGTLATLTALPNGDCEFVCWNNFETSSTISFIVFDDTTITATFTPEGQPMHILMVETQNELFGTTEGTGVYAENTDITISATANANYQFKQWSDGVIDNPRTMQIISDSTIMAMFVPDTFMITAVSNDDVMGAVDGGGRYAYNTSVVLIANPNPYYTFRSWLDGDTNNPRTVVVTGNETYIANFNPVYFNITVTSDNQNMGTVYGSDAYAHNTIATISAYPNTGYKFSHWNDNNTENPRDILVTQDSSFVAYFIEDVGVDEVDVMESILVYPNPAASMVSVNVDGVLKIDILDMNGRTLISKEHSNKIDISEIPDGVYTMKVVLPQGEVIRKIVKMASNR